MRILVLGYLVRGPLGGMAWHHLQYVLGLVRLGHDVHFSEDSEDFPACYDPSQHVLTTDPSFGLRFAADAFNGLGLPEDMWSYHDSHTSRWLGPGAAVAEQFSRSADVVLNVSGSNPMREWNCAAPVRVFIDTDPAFTQIDNLTKPAATALASQHNSFFTYGENIPRGTDRLPDDGIAWKATRQPIVLDRWTVTPPSDAAYNTVMQWDSYPPVKYEGIEYGTKAVSFKRFIDFPARAGVPLEIALGSNSAPRDLLRENGWSLVNPLEACRTPWDYQSYIGQSRGEFTVAKQGYTVSNCGWFSDRSAAYLASGKPVVTEETGFSEVLPTGEGLFAFTDPQTAGEALALIESDYDRHSRRARVIAEEFFAADIVLGKLLDEV